MEVRMNTKHTPGPWKVNATPHSSNQDWVVLDSGTNGRNKRVCAVYSDNDEADARLIAAAPELLEALIGLLDEVNDMSGRCGWMGNGFRAKAHAALAKARGEHVS
jgi:hypothetical protein